MSNQATIYRIVQTWNNKTIYVGSTQKELKYRMRKHLNKLLYAPGRPLYAHMIENGKHNFAIEKICDCHSDTKDGILLQLGELAVIEQFDCFHNGFNCSQPINPGKYAGGELPMYYLICE